MLSFIAAIFSAILGFGAGIVGQPNLAPNAIPSQPGQTNSYRACFLPRPDITLTLTWPDDFVNVPDYRPSLNPQLYSDLPPTFNSTADTDNDSYPDCKALVMNSYTADDQVSKVIRNYILVRTDLRISSCKTDELAGPYANDAGCPRPEESRHRGSCTTADYTDLRKVAQAVQNGEQREIFWNPFSYNTGCNYQQDVNCGPGDRQNVNLKDFVYVLKKRDAFDLNDNPGCPVLWDAGSTNIDACSHYFDLYMASDVYDAMRAAPDTTDPHSDMYFLKQIVENCNEQTYFTPAPSTLFTIPPSFIEMPFLADDLSDIGIAYKINPTTGIERENYQIYIWDKPDTFRPDLTNLVQTTQISGLIKICTDQAPEDNCYDKLGIIYFKDGDGVNHMFHAYTQKNSPQTFLLVRDGNLSVGYVYTITDRNFPSNTRHDPTLQLRSMEFIAQNQWTWATPWCKPAIYLYPEKERELNVKLTLDGKLTASDPPYKNQIGWNVLANPNGQLSLKDTSDGGIKTYPYLYYEADITGVDIPNQGWAVEKSNIKYQISNMMREIGFNNQEISDFLDYWLPRLKEKPYYFLTFLPEDQINQKEQLELSIQPDTLIRTRFVFEGLDGPISVKPLENIPHHLRNGFTVTDWGGTLIGQSCTDISVK